MRGGEDRPASGRRERFERRPPRRGERPEVEKNEVVKDPVRRANFRSALTGDRQPPGVPGYGSNGACTAGAAGRKKVIAADGAPTGRADCAGAGTTGVRYVTETELIKIKS
ncbi:MAG: hypothetical protein ACLR8P_23285 [Clostridium fessum]